jgi:hypothetical protein
MSMAYDTQTLEPLHGLTEEGKEHYHEMLERIADDMLYASKHPLRALVSNLKFKIFG